MRKTFKVGKEEKEAFQYIGLELLSEEESIILLQDKHGRSIEPIQVSKTRVLQKDDRLIIKK